MPDMRERLNQIRQAQRKGAPSMRPQAKQAKPKEDEEEVYDIRELALNPVDADRFMRLAAQYKEHQSVESTAKKQKELVGASLKAICNDYGLRKVMADDLRVTYYETHRSSIDAVLLKAHGVKPSVIAACTATTDSWALRVGVPGKGDDYD